MIKEAIATGLSVEEAKENACAKLGIDSDEICFEIIDLPEKKVLGLFGGKVAKVRAYIPEESEADTAESKQIEKSSNDNKKHSVPSEEEASTQQVIYKDDNTQKDNEQTKSIAIDCVKELLSHILDNSTDVNINVEDVEGGIQLNINGDNLSFLIGHKGETLYSLQYIVSLMVKNKLSSNTCKIYLDVSNYREKRKNTLVSLASKKAAYAKKAHRKISLEPMSSYERRIIHCAIQEKEGVSSWSEGLGHKRHIVIAPDNMKDKSHNSSFEHTEKHENKENLNIESKDESPLYGRIK